MCKTMKPAEAMELLMEEIQRLQKAERLLRDVWFATGLYRTGTLPDELRWKLDDFFLEEK